MTKDRIAREKMDFYLCLHRELTKMWLGEVVRMWGLLYYLNRAWGVQRDTSGRTNGFWGSTEKQLRETKHFGKINFFSGK